MNSSNRQAIVVGGGPAGMMAAEVMSNHGVPVDLFEANPWVGRKFLVAGKGGLNLTHSEPFDTFILRYGKRMEKLKPILVQFGPSQLQEWVNELGFNTFIGSSGRVFPVGMKSSPILRAWIQKLSSNGVRIHNHHKWLGWGKGNQILFDTPVGRVYKNWDVLILALGGGSRPKLGSNGAWVSILREKGVDSQSLKPSNCGFDVKWSDHFRSRFEGQPVRQTAALFRDSEGEIFAQQGEFIISHYGLEGSLIYAASSMLRDEIERNNSATIHLDLAPDWSLQKLEDRLSRSRGKQSLANHLRKSIGFEGVKTGLLHEVLSEEIFNQPHRLADAIKKLPIVLDSPRPLEEAISSAGGVPFESLDESLMIKGFPGVFCAGEMLDWEAPTGGYMLTACFATGFHAGYSAVEYLKRLDS